jgi:hypothetical protein
MSMGISVLYLPNCWPEVSMNLEVPFTGHFDTVFFFVWSSVFKQMLRWLPKIRSCFCMLIMHSSPSDLNLSKLAPLTLKLKVIKFSKLCALELKRNQNSAARISGYYCHHFGARGGAVGRGTALQTGRSRVRSPMVSLEIFSCRDSSVGIATRYGLDGPGIESRWGARFSAPVQTGPGAHPASCTMGTGSKAAEAWC